MGALQENSYLRNFGITGPRDTNNARLMTQSFAHCTHLRIFGWYYPPAFANWYSDDWATQVYGTKNTFWRRDVEVAHKLVRYSDNGSTATAVNFPQVTLPSHEGRHRLLHIHRNEPGVLAAMNAVAEAEALDTFPAEAGAAAKAPEPPKA